MNSFTLFLAGAAALLTAQAAPFRNLGFDEADTNRVRYYSSISGGGPAVDLLPGWQLYHGENLQTNLYFNGGTDVPYANLIALPVHSDPIYRVEGAYAIVLVGTQFNEVPFSLVQRGEFPKEAAFLRYLYAEDPFTISIDEVKVQATRVLSYASTPKHVTYDVSAYAGKTVELKVSTLSLSPGSMFDSHFLDSIEFVARPTLQVSRSGSDVVLSWPSSITGFLLENTDTLLSTNTWQTVATTPVMSGNEQTVTVEAKGKARFFRLSLAP